jgi:hypothetical protein
VQTVETPDTTIVRPAVTPETQAARVSSWQRAGVQHALVAGLLAVLALGFMTPGLPPDRVAAPLEGVLIYPPWHAELPDVTALYAGGDLLLQQLPWRHWMQQELAAGRFPLWAPGPAGGLPLFASYQPGVLSPLHLLWVLLPVGAGLGLILALKLWLAGLGMWLFLRGLQLHPAAALLSAIGLMFSTWLVNWLTWAHTSVYVFLPWILWTITAWCHDRRPWAVPVLVGFTGCAVLGGHPETLFIIGLTAAGWAAGLIVSSPVRRWPGHLAGLALGAGVGLALGAIQVLPFLEVLDLTQAAASRAGSGITSHFEPIGMIDWVLPRYFGHPAEGVLGTYPFTEGNGYVGLVALVGLGLAGIALLRRRLAWRILVPWVALGLLAWLLVFDVTAGAVIRALPVFSHSANQRWIAILEFAVLVVSALGWNWLARHLARLVPAAGGRWSGGWLGGAGLVLLVEGLVGLGIHGAGLIPPPVQPPYHLQNTLPPNYQLYWAGWAGAVALVVVGATMLWAASGSGARWLGRLAPAILGAVLVLDLWRLLQPVIGTAPAVYYFPPNSFIDQVREAVPPTDRILIVGEVFPPNTPLIYGVRDWRVQDPMISARAFQAAVRIDPDLPKSPWTAYNMYLHYARMGLASLLGMRYFIYPTDTNPNNPPEPDPGRPNFKRLAFKDGLGLWEAEGVPGFTYLSDRVQAVATGDAALDWMQARSWVEVRAYPAVVEAAPQVIAGIRPGGAGESPGSTTILNYTPGVVRIQAEATRPALLVVAESWYPGWRATLDGQAAPILRANYLSQGVVVPAGRHVVELRYQPDSFTIGAALSGLAALAGLALVVWAVRGSSPRAREMSGVKP